MSDFELVSRLRNIASQCTSPEEVVAKVNKALPGVAVQVTAIGRQFLGMATVCHRPGPLAF